MSTELPGQMHLFTIDGCAPGEFDDYEQCECGGCACDASADAYTARFGDDPSPQ